MRRVSKARRFGDGDELQSGRGMGVSMGVWLSVAAAARPLAMSSRVVLDVVRLADTAHSA